MDSDSGLIEGLQQFNSEFRRGYTVTKSETDSLGISFADLIEIILADIGGAYSGAEIGAELGLEIGSLVGLPAYGGLTFAFCGAVGIGAFESYYAFPDSTVAIPADTTDYVPDSAFVALAPRPQKTVESDYEYMIQSITNAVMLEQMNGGSGSFLNNAMIDSNVISIPLMNTQDIHKYAGYLHNVVLADLIKREQPNGISNCEINAGQSVQSAIHSLFDDSRFKMAILDRERHLGTVVAENNISSKVLACFEDVFRTSIYCVDDLCNVVNAYIARIEESGEVDERGKDSLMYAFSVAYHSFCFWTNHYNR